MLIEFNFPPFFKLDICVLLFLSYHTGSPEPEHVQRNEGALDPSFFCLIS